MNASPPPPPPPPPHGSKAGGRNGLPDGPYDIFIVPPHSSGGGFIYFPSLQTNRNSFLAGVACTLVAVMIWSVVIPALRDWMSSAARGGSTVILLLLGVGVAGWAWGKTQTEGATFGFGGADGASRFNNTGSGNARQSGTFGSDAKSTPSWQRANGAAGAGNGTAKGGWEKAREETRKKEEERKRADELRKKRENEEKERIRKREQDAREREARERREQAGGGRRNHRHPTAHTAADDESQFSYRPYDTPKSAASSYSESSYGGSHSTRKTTPPPSHRGPYQCKDPDKIVISAVYSFNNAFAKNAIAKLISGVGSVTDGLVLRVTTEGLFIDDDVRGVPQREWDVKAWTLKLVESGETMGYHVLRASIRDAEGKRYVFILREEEGWKVAIGLQRLRRGTQVRALGVSGLPVNESKAILQTLGYI